jgi:8-oxo-dGTP pyrophosphatase MutT (NUDIX family)
MRTSESRIKAPVPLTSPDPRFSLARVVSCLESRPHVEEECPEGVRRAAVLLLLTDGPDGVEVLLTRRSHDVSDHKGQVSLPGGAIDPEDVDSRAAALREASEEVGLAPARAQVLGRLDDYVTITGFHIVPWVAAIDDFEDLGPRTSEIEEVFRFPLAYLADERHVLRVPWKRPGSNDDALFIPYGEQLLWGVTARILYRLLEILS